MSTPTPPSDPYGTGPSDAYGAGPTDPYGDPAPWQQGRAPGSGDGQGPGGLAVAALVVGIVAFLIGLAPFLGLLAGAAAVVLGIVVLRRSRQGGGTARTFGLVGVIGGGLAVLASLATTVLFAIGLAALPGDTAADAGEVQFAPSIDASIAADVDGAYGSIDPGQSQATKVACDLPADVTPTGSC